VLFSNTDRAWIKFSFWFVNGYAHVFVLVSVVTERDPVNMLSFQSE